ncbi:MAG: MTH1187 family thiamine-binding protein [Caldisericaceae bacterium]|nr:MTH1187 family thiamine-binding protein [Caldisericaceae bacterium]
MAMIEFSVVPIGTKSASVSQYVAQAINIVKKYEGQIQYELTPMGTIIEGDLDLGMEIVMKVHKALFSDEVKRVVTNIKIDDRIDKDLTLAGKVKSVMEKIK